MNFDAWVDMVAQSKLGYRTTMMATYDLCLAVLRNGVEGDFAECGVYAGAELAMMARAAMDHGLGRRVHAFDSFQGIPQPGIHDDEMLAAHQMKGGACCPMDDVKHNLRNWGIPEDLIVWHPGWFANTVPQFTGQLALLRLDGDLYESTKVCLDHLYPKLSVGGWCILDDYPLSGARKAMHEVVYPQPVYWQVVV